MVAVAIVPMSVGTYNIDRLPSALHGQTAVKQGVFAAFAMHARLAPHFSGVVVGL